jgi:DNA modification methylase
VEYGLRDYGIEGQLGKEKTPQQYIQNLMDIMNECKRVLKKTGSLWVNIGDSYSTKTKGDSRNPEKQREKRRQEMDINSEMSFGRHSEEWFKAQHQNNSVRKIDTGLQDKSLIGIPERFVIAMTDSNWIRRNTVIWKKDNTMPSSAKDRLTNDFEYFYFFVKSPKYYFETQYEPLSIETIKRYQRGVSETNKWVNGPDGQTKHTMNQPRQHDKTREHPQKDIGRIKRCVWTINTRPFSGAHFAVFPEKLVETPIRACCPLEICNKCGKPREKIMETQLINRNKPKGTQLTMAIDKRDYIKGGRAGDNIINEIGLSDCNCNAGFHSGVVLDPFMGAGTTAVVAKKLGRQWVGIELNESYITLAENRINSIL